MGTAARNVVVLVENGCSDGGSNGIGYSPMNRLLFGYWTRENDYAAPRF